MSRVRLTFRLESPGREFPRKESCVLGLLWFGIRFLNLKGEFCLSVITADMSRKEGDVSAGKIVGDKTNNKLRSNGFFFFFYAFDFFSAAPQIIRVPSSRRVQVKH